MNVVFFRIFVTKSSQLSLLDDITLSKPELIKKAFTSSTDPIYFSRGGKKYAFVVEKVADPYIYASLAKQSHVKIKHSPEQGFEEESVETWPNVPVIISFDGDPESGQVMAVELNRSIFEFPHVQIRELVAELNSQSLKHIGYEMAINAITESNDFWESIRKNEGSIKSVEFHFVAPNLFGARDSLNRELIEARDTYEMTQATVKLENSEGELKVPENSPFISEGVQYVSDGGGDYKINLKQRITITSDDSIKSKTIEERELEIAAKNSETFKDFCDRLFLWLKH